MTEKWIKEYRWPLETGKDKGIDSFPEPPRKRLAPWKKSYDQPRQHIQKQRHQFADKGLSSQSYGFPVVMYGCEIWTIKKAEHRRIDTFELQCWRRLPRVPWTARRSNQSTLKEISPEYVLEGLMLKLKLQYFGHLVGRTDWLEKTLMLGKTEGGRRRGCQRMRWPNEIYFRYTRLVQCFKNPSI